MQERLLGDWVSLDGEENMKVRRLDDNVYIVYYEGDLFRAYHSDVAETPFVSVRTLTRATASMLMWFGSSPMMASV